MQSWLCGMLLGLIGATAFAENTPPDPDAWYRLSYAPLWENDPWDKVDQMLGHYADTVTTHEADGGVSTADKNDWLAAPMAEWREDGWLSARLLKLDSDQINASTASFKASWLDSYSGGATEKSCGWYLADYSDGGWSFTHYADIDCAAHGF